MWRLNREMQFIIKVVFKDNSTSTRPCDGKDLYAIDTLQDAVDFTLKGNGDRSLNEVASVQLVREETLYKVGDKYD